MFEFENEDASGDGVNREAYTTFFNEIYELFEGNAECVDEVREVAPLNDFRWSQD